MDASPDSPQPVLDEIRQLIGDLVLRPPEEIRPESLLMPELDIDSLGLIELIFAIEDRFKIKFPDLKTNAQMMSLSLPEALEVLDGLPGGTTLLEFMKGEVVRHAGMPVEREAANLRFRRATVEELSRAVGAPLIGFEPNTRLEQLHLMDAFRVITVDVLARYVVFLMSQPAADG